MMTRLLLISVLGLSLLGCNKTEDAIAQQQFIYKRAMEAGDYLTATYALYNQLALDSSNVAVKDSLAQLYFRRGFWTQSASFGQEVLNANPQDTATLERVADAQFFGGEYKGALESYQKLKAVKNNAAIQYQIAMLKFENGDAQGGLQDAQALIQNPEAKSMSVVVLSQAQNGQRVPQNVPVIAAAHNLVGWIAAQANNRQQAELNFLQALQYAPGFRLAFNNLSAISPDKAKEFADAVQKAIAQQRQQQQQQQQSLVPAP